MDNAHLIFILIAFLASLSDAAMTLLAGLVGSSNSIRSSASVETTSTGTCLDSSA